ncbi:hypothetical protein GPA_20060 [Gordonibacter pamelaeae 7-10-1-b]|uniref:Uncharacterized protein n=1 Tax=Gordonibacter pamelaeae 7-10-1-b TaxID=657308 RepID=D6E9H6_9ACTN|nr:hypothetical protein GPA_20060 [Gordonibacter pamelaeae 7-10-1-b]
MAALDALGAALDAYDAAEA